MNSGRILRSLALYALICGLAFGGLFTGQVNASGLPGTTSRYGAPAGVVSAGAPLMAVLEATSADSGETTPTKTGGAPQEGQAFNIISVKHEMAGPVTRILIEGDAPPAYAILRPTDRLVVVELPGGDSAKLATIYMVKSPLVDSVTVRKPDANRAGTPPRRLKTRVEIALSALARDRSTLVGNTLVIELSPTGQAVDRQVADWRAASGNSEAEDSTADRGDKKANTPEPTAKEAAKDDQGDDSGKTSQPGVYVYPVPVKKAGGQSEKADKASPPAAAAFHPATTISSVRSQPTSGGGVDVFVEADGILEYKDFILTSPSRIVVDITGVRNQAGNKVLQVGVGSVERVRVGQPSANVVRIVLDASGKAPYRVTRNGSSLVISVGGSPRTVSQALDGAPAPEASQKSSVMPPAVRVSASTPSTGNTFQEPKLTETSKSQKNSSKEDNKDEKASVSKSQPAGQTVAEAMAHQSSGSGATSTASKAAGPGSTGSNPQNATGAAGQSHAKETIIQQAPAKSEPLIARNNVPDDNRSGKPASAPASGGSSVKPGVRSGDASGQTTIRPQEPDAQHGADMLCDRQYVGGPISFDLRKGVDLRDMLRFISTQYGVNFIVDKSVTDVPVELRISDVPWNWVIDTVLKANRLGLVCDSGGRILRVATLTAIKEEAVEKQAIEDQKAKSTPLETVIRHLKYARAAGVLGGNASRTGGGGSSSGSGGGSSGISGGQGGQGGGSFLAIVNTRLSPRGKVEVDGRTNSLIITDLPENIRNIQSIIDYLDHPDPQVEIEARIIVADKNFLRDLGVVLGGGAVAKSGKAGVFETTPVQLGSGGLTPGTTSGGSSGGTTNPLGPNLIGPVASGVLASTANSVLSLTTGALGTGILSAALTASETKGQIRTVSSPRIVTQDNIPAEVVNGVQIPVQTVSNNTVTTTFITAALRLQITPQIVEETGEVTMKVVAENNTVNTAFANQFNGGTPGINTQSAETTVRVQDGGTTVMGGINIDTESNSQNRTPGVSKIPLLGELFKRRTVSRDSNEILFFITPRIVRGEGPVVPPGSGTQRSSVYPLVPVPQTQPDKGKGDTKAVTAVAAATKTSK